MKKYLVTTAFVLISTVAFAAGTTEYKGTSSNGSGVGKASSQFTGNGATISGNGNGIGPDQTNAPGSRSDNVHSFQGGSGPGNSDGSAGNSHH